MKNIRFAKKFICHLSYINVLVNLKRFTFVVDKCPLCLLTSACPSRKNL
jgi:hypothetical protein